MKKLNLLLLSIFLLWTFQSSLKANTSYRPKTAWKFESGAPIRGSVAIQNNLLLFGNAAGMIYCLDKHSGKLVWSHKVDDCINSKPGVRGAIAVFSGRNKYIYAFETTTGKPLWKFAMKPFALHKWGWDFFQSSPVLSGSNVFVGSGDQNIYALNAKTGKVVWQFHTNGKIRATPAVDNGNLFVPSFDGFVYVLDPSSGALKWKFETDGVKLDSDKSGWDRCSINSSPALQDSLMVFGSRDGNIYCVNRQSKQSVWKFTHGPSWCLASPAVDGNSVFVGWSDAQLFDAIDIRTGKELWKYDLKSVAYSSPVTDKTNVYVGAGNGKFYAFDKERGNVNWEYATSGPVYSSPIFDEGTLYFGSDDGTLYALNAAAKTYRAVFLEDHFKSKFIKDIMVGDSGIAPYFVSKGYERLDSASLFRFLTDRIEDGAPSAIVFGQEYIPSNILGPDPKTNMIREYMEKGGKIVWTGQTINWIKLDDHGQPLGNNNVSYAEQLLDMSFDIPDESGLYFAKATGLGLQWGLPKTLNANFAIVADKNISVLAYNEFGRPAIWFRHFGQQNQSGFVNIRTWGYLSMPAGDKDLELVRRMAEFGL